MPYGIKVVMFRGGAGILPVGFVWKISVWKEWRKEMRFFSCLGSHWSICLYNLYYIQFVNIQVIYSPTYVITRSIVPARIFYGKNHPESECNAITRSATAAAVICLWAILKFYDG